MSQHLVPVRQDALELVSRPDAAAGAASFDPQCVFELIERTAETIRWLQQENERAAEREQACLALLAREQALWQGDLDNLRLAAEACLTRAAASETEAMEAKAQARLAVLVCKETQTREQAATARAEAAEERARAAEQWLARISQTLSADVRVLLEPEQPARRSEAPRTQRSSRPQA